MANPTSGGGRSALGKKISQRVPVKFQSIKVKDPNDKSKTITLKDAAISVTKHAQEELGLTIYDQKNRKDKSGKRRVLTFGFGQNGGRKCKCNYKKGTKKKSVTIPVPPTVDIVEMATWLKANAKTVYSFSVGGGRTHNIDALLAVTGPDTNTND